MCGFLPRALEMEEIVHQLAHRGNSRGAAHQHHFVDLLGRDAGVGQGLLAGTGGARQHRLDQLLEDRAGNLALIAVAVGQLDVEVRRRLGGEPNLGIDGGLAQRLHRAGMARRSTPCSA